MWLLRQKHHLLSKHPTLNWPIGQEKTSVLKIEHHYPLYFPKSPQYSLCIIATMKWTSGLLVFLYFLSDVKGLFKSRQIKVEETVQDQSCVKQFLGVQTKPYPQRYIPREVGCCHKIVGGQEVCRRYPWVLGLWRNWGSRPFCGGSLINDRWMLTGGIWSFNSE